MMKRFFFKLILVLICFMPIAGHAQEAAAKEKTPATSKAHKKAAKEKWKEQRKLEKDQKKAVKEHHKRIQTKDTRKTMRKEKRKGEKMRANKKEFFLVRWINNLRR